MSRVDNRMLWRRGMEELENVEGAESEVQRFVKWRYLDEGT
jgi:hypothetical protein